MEGRQCTVGVEGLSLIVVIGKGSEKFMMETSANVHCSFIISEDTRRDADIPLRRQSWRRA